MWIRKEIIEAVDRVATIFYIDVITTKAWNANRKEGELRLMTGWVWSEKARHNERMGFKNITTAYIDAWYALVMKIEPPYMKRNVSNVQRKR